MEASAIQAGPGLGRPRITLGTPLLRLRSDQQLVTLFREGNEEAFGVIHDRYRARLLAYVRQMLPGRAADVEDALQDVFVRTYAGLRTSNREVALRPWLYRVAHNRCIDELRRQLPAPEVLDAQDHFSESDPATVTEQRASLRQLVVDIERLPEQQRSALLMREMSGMAYADVAGALGISVPAVKSLLVRARIGLAQALQARDTACLEIRRQLAEAHEEGVRPSWMARRHLRDCAGCRACRAQMRTQGRQVAALAPTVGPLAVLAKLLGIGTGAGGGTATAASAGGATVAGGTATAASGLATVTVGHVATILAAAIVTAGGAVAVQQTVATQSPQHAKPAVRHTAPAAPAAAPVDETMRVPARKLLPPPAASPTQASPVRHAAPVTSTSTTHPAQWRNPAVHLPPGSLNNVDDMSGTAYANASTTTCTPPPTACTASQTTCSTGSGSTTSSGTQTTTTSQSTTTAQTTTGTTTTSGSGTTGSGATTTTGTGTTSPTTSGTASATTGASCSTSTQSTGSEPVGSTSSGQTGATTQPAKPA